MSLKRQLAIRRFSMGAQRPVIADWKLPVSLALLGLIAVMSCDKVNTRLTRYFAPPAQQSPNTRTWTKGSVHEVDVTLVTKDMNRLQCADDREFDGAHCEYTTDKKRRRRSPGAPFDDNRANIIQPYRTHVGNHLVFIAGLWNTPALAYRHHQEPPLGKTDKQLIRFVAKCRLRFVGAMTDVTLRWNTSAKWYQEKYAPVALAQWCDIPKNDSLGREG